VKIVRISVITIWALMPHLSKVIKKKSNAHLVHVKAAEDKFKRKPRRYRRFWINLKTIRCLYCIYKYFVVEARWELKIEADVRFVNSRGCFFAVHFLVSFRNLFLPSWISYAYRGHWSLLVCFKKRNDTWSIKFVEIMIKGTWSKKLW